MRRTKKVLAAGAVGVTLLAGMLVLPAGLAAADSAPEAASIEALAERVAGAAGVATVDEGDEVTARIGGGEVSVSVDPDQGQVLDPDVGPSVSIGVPGSPDQGTEIDGSVVYPEVAADASVVARATADGAQALVAIDGAEAPTRYAFPVAVAGHGAELRPGPGGGVEVLDPVSGAVAATVQPPWAVDAAGSAVPTRYEIDGSDLIQVVDHEGSAYPVLADPDVVKNCGTISCTWYWSVAATHRLADALLGPDGGLAAGITSGVACYALAATGPGGLACGLIYTAGSYALARALNAADRGNRCFTVSTPPRLTFGSVSQTNSRCHRR